MYNFKKLTLYLSTFLLLVLSLKGCSTSSLLINEADVWVDHSISNKIFTDRTLTIFPFLDKIITIDNIEDITKTYNVDSIDAAKLLRDSLYNFLCSRSKRKVTNVNLNKKDFLNETKIDFSDKDNFFEVAQSISVGKSYTYLIPKEDFLNSLEIEPDIILIINKIETSHGATSYSHVSPASGIMGVTSTNFLGVMSEFIIWDYKTSKPIKYGSALVKTNLENRTMNETLQESYEHLIQEIVYKTPFERKAGVRTLLLVE